MVVTEIVDDEIVAEDEHGIKIRARKRKSDVRACMGVKSDVRACRGLNFNFLVSVTKAWLKRTAASVSDVIASPKQGEACELAGVTRERHAYAPEYGVVPIRSQGVIT